MIKKNLLLLTFLLVLFAGLRSGKIAEKSAGETFHAGTPVNPTIQAIVDSISSDSITAYLKELIGFHTRHTASDTTSADTGIGAARRWIKTKFDESSGVSGGALQPEFFWFTATICGTTGPHANLMATLPGTLPQAQDRNFVVSAHMDSRTVGPCDNTSFAPGANDDGSGTAAAIELARVMSTKQFDANLIFMTFTGEEQGLFGSEAYASWAASNNVRIDGVLNNDIIGNIIAPDGSIDSTTVRLFSESPSTSPSRQLTRYLKLKGEQYVPEITINLIPAQDRPGRGGDHISFNDNGYAAVRFTEATERVDQHQHNAGDTLGAMSPSYTTKITKICAAGLASLALAPATPSAPLMARNVGNGTELLLSWTMTNIEPDFDGYRVAWRHADSLFYQDIAVTGNVTQFTLSGLTPNQPVYICYSALDTAGNESIFSPEVLATPSIIPATPMGLDATSTPTEVQLNWRANSELDLAGYKITRVDPDSVQQIFIVDAADTNFVDNTLQAHTLYHYNVKALDTDGNESTPSPSVRGQLATHDQGILIVDATRDGPSPGNPLFPTDMEVDTFYENILSNFNLSAQWDIADSLQQQLAISDADMGIYSTVIIHSDVRFQDYFIVNDTLALKRYLQNGGQLLMIGWQLATRASDNNLSIKNFVPGEFVYDFMKIDSAEIASISDFRGANPTPAASGYPSIAVDSLKIPNYGGNLTAMEVFQSLVDSALTEVLFTYHSSQQPPSQFHGRPVAIRHNSSNLKIIVLGFPLYYMQEGEAIQTITQALLDLGEPTGIGEEHLSNLKPGKFDLSQNYPNPFNPVTFIRYRLPSSSEVTLTIYNLRGQQVTTLLSAKQEAGDHIVKWDGRDQMGRSVASGIYFYRLQSPEFSKVKKLILIR